MFLFINKNYKYKLKKTIKDIYYYYSILISIYIKNKKY